jgi:hypothetical protein
VKRNEESKVDIALPGGRLKSKIAGEPSFVGFQPHANNLPPHRARLIRFYSRTHGNSSLPHDLLGVQSMKSSADIWKYTKVWLLSLYYNGT